MQSSFPQSNTPQIRRAGVDLNGVMSVLSKHLYSTPTVALRELVQNAHDSILRRRLEQPDWQGPSRIEVIGDSASNTVRIVDTGAGLTEHEIHAYLATVGVGYTRGLRQSGHEDSGLIGMFGLGFLSAFVLARRVSVRTTSYQHPELGFCYVSSNAEQYSVTPMPARPVGTEITLELQDEYSALTQAARLREILERYCVLLREPIHVGGDAQPIFALCRPPGHHAGGDFMGGYCFLNNAAIATQAFLDQGARRVAILDVDYHHGNGTQDIFYRRDDVLFASIHGDPRVEYPYFLGYADERGEGAGEGCNHNYPLAHGSGWDLWSAALDDACVRIAGYAPDALVISLGVDTYKEDPISQFKLDSPDYLRMGERIARLGLPTLFIMEGGYAVEAIGINAVNVLQGYEGAAR
ncbi:acetylpolyamine aminohydrolase [Pseudomonas aeruginosa VRFPA03]|nr:acetylpolyamine aminohydrolase [Pseudomonas aeruginosa VRFPA03]